MSRTPYLLSGSITLLLCSLVLVCPGLSEGAEPTGPAPVDSGWLSRVQESIRDSEYEITWQTETSLPDLQAAYHAPNRAHGFRTYFTDSGIRVVPRIDTAPTWEWGLSLVGYGRGKTTGATEDASLFAEKNRMEYDRGEILEWYVNDPQGLKQGFTLASPPDGEGMGPGHAELVLTLTGTLSPEVSSDGQAIDFTAPGGVRVLRYAGLSVTDATGRELPARIEASVEGGIRYIRLLFEDRDAIYPVTIDPLTTSPAWSAEGNQASAYFGSSVATAGDVNGDGFSDVVIGAPFFDNGHSNEGRVFVYHGSASGLATGHSWSAEGNQSGSTFAWSVGTAGDVNGDGFSDLIVGARDYDNGQTNEGQAFVYHGSGSGLSATPDWTAQADQDYASFGFSVATAGDVNGDGCSDVIVGARVYDGGNANEGRAFVFHGCSPAGLSASPDWIGEINQDHAWFGFSVGTAGDIDADGCSEVIVGASRFDNGQTDEGGAFVYHGCDSGSGSGLSTTPDWSLEPDLASANFGVSVGTAGDVNGNGHADVAVGAHQHSGEGRAFVYHGSSLGLSSTPDWTGDDGQTGSFFGWSLSTAGDVNGDGYADLIVGAERYGDPESEEGAAFVFLGSATGLAAAAVWSVESNQAGAHFGGAVATAGDVDGDGFSDVLVGASLFTNGHSDEGAAFVYRGSAAGPSLAPGWDAEGGQGGARLGYSVATAGDVNGDGYADAVVGAYLLDNGQTNEGMVFLYPGSPAGLSPSATWTAEGNQDNAGFGYSVATAGDVNGDGYSDLMVGAIFYDNGQSNEGLVTVYHGSATGLDHSGAAGCPVDADWCADSNQAGAQLGGAVASAGDVNGDGYSDVIAGAHYFDNPESNEGRVFLYIGSATGLRSGPGWTAEGNQANAEFGSAVASAGDVNGDGYSEVIVGASSYDDYLTDQGRAYVYYGSVSGPVSYSAWVREGDKAQAAFGSSVAAAGDVNGDGLSDVIIGAPQFTNDASNEGRAYVFHGSASGLPYTADWFAEGDQAGALLGSAVSTAGDVNGDGFADVLIGAPGFTSDPNFPEGGRAAIYYGSASGLSLVEDWSASGTQAYQRLASAASTAGDVNGDGYADVILGAHLFDNGQTDEGGAWVYYGNGGPGMALAPRQRRSDDSAPIASLGLSDSPDEFRLAMWGRTPFGAGRVKLSWEVKPLGSLFDGTGTDESTSWTASGAAGTTLNEIVSGAPSDAVLHWRARILYDPATTPFQQASRWITIPWNGWQEADLRTPPAPCLDVDGDGFGLPGSSLCPGGPATDCDDSEAEIYPGATQLCDGLNNDCDDASWPTVPVDEVDDDGDTFAECEGDCDDSEADVYPGATQLCDGLNNDCDDVSWPTVPVDEVDNDGDTFAECEGDCDDSEADVYPGATQLCDGLNNDCTHASWPGLTGTNEHDDDGDGLSECDGDLNDANGTAWGIPGEVEDLFMENDGSTGITTLTWNPPLDLGALSVLYDTIRSQDPADYVTGTFCVSSNAAGTTATDTAVPAVGARNLYFIRAENSVPAMGGGGRPGRTCP